MTDVITNQNVPILNQKKIRDMASGLRYVLGIPEGKELIYILGQGQEDNNAEAIESWIAEQLMQYPQTDTSGLFERLRTKLSRTLGLEDLY